MNTTTHLARHMLAMSPNKDASRLCLYHYLIHHCPPETPLTPQLFENFCRMALMHEFWQKKTMDLSQELQFVIQHYNETFMLDWKLSDFVFPDNWQIVNIKNSLEGIHILEKWARKHFESGQKTRVFYTKDQNYIVLVQTTSGELNIIWTSPQMLIQKAELQPLNTEIQLQYKENLELKSDVAQYLKVEQNTYARFQVREKDVKGILIRGYVFQNHMELKGRINEYPDIYYPLKKMEQFYIDRQSDPDYQELISILEKSIELFSINHPESKSFGKTALDRAKSALDNIFTSDNAIQTLVDQLEQKLFI